MRLLHRYVLGELLGVALVALVFFSFFLVVVFVIDEAHQQGFGMAQVVLILPYLVPGTLPYTVPATTLLATSIVYGRMAGAGEITAIKAAGINLLSILWPALALGGVLSGATLYLADRFVPWARAQVRATVLATAEDVLYDRLRHDLVFNSNNENLNFTIAVERVVGRRLINPLFRYQPAGEGDLVAQAREAVLQVDFHKGLIQMRMDEAHVISGNTDLYLARFEHPIALPGWDQASQVKPQDLSSRQIAEQVAEMEPKAAEPEAAAAVRKAFAVVRGAPAALLVPPSPGELFEQKRLVRHIQRLKTELHSRRALAFSCLFFVLLGAPVAIWGARRDFLGNFFSCFFPILVLYYPMVIASMNFSKDGRVDPAWALWLGNLVLGAVGGLVLRRVLRH